MFAFDRMINPFSLASGIFSNVLLFSSNFLIMCAIELFNWLMFFLVYLSLSS